MKTCYLLPSLILLFHGPALLADREQSEHKIMEEVYTTGKLTRYSATKSDTPIMVTTRSVSIENQQQIIDKGALTLDQTYTYSAGVTGETYGFATRGDWVKVRGLDVPQYQDSLQSLFGNYNNTRPDIYTLEQVEILKGPASVLYGKGSPGGLINVVSKRPQAESEHEVVLEGGTFNHQQLAFDSTGPLSDDGQWLYRVIGVYRDNETQVDFVDDKTKVIAPSLTWQPNDATSATLLINYTETESDTATQFLPIPGTLFPADNGKRIDTGTYLGEPDFNQYDAETLSVTLLANHQINDTWGVELTTRYTDATVDYQQAWPSFIGGDRYVRNPDDSLYKDGTVPRSFYKSDASSDQIAADLRFRADFMQGDVEHRVLFGSTYQDVTTDNDGYTAFALGASTYDDTYWINVFNPQYGAIPPAALLDSLYTNRPETSSKDMGFYISDEMSFHRWIVTLGLRYDNTETETGSERQDDEALSTSVGVLYQFESGLSAYISYAESFEPVIGDNGNGQALDPQEGQQTEVGIKYEPQRFPGIITLAYFDIKQSNLSDPFSLPGSFEQQGGEANIKGVELESVLNFGDITLELNVSKLDSESAYGYQLNSVPEKQASSWISYRPTDHWQGFKLGAGIRYVGESYGGADTIRTPSYTLHDAMIGYEIGHWDFAVNVHNLTNEDYFATCLVRGDCWVGKERTAVARMRYKF